MDLYRLGIKFFVTDDSASVPLERFIPIFHTWIQRQVPENHLLIDVADYRHMHYGPGVLLVAHEANFSMDLSDGRLGLLYSRKQPAADLGIVLKSALEACRLLEAEPSLEGHLHFGTDELLIIASDRLNAPNDEKTFLELQPILTGTLKRVMDRSDFTLTRVSTDPKERLIIRAHTQ